MQTRRFVLASGSPRRRELLEKMGYTFEIVRPEVDEHIPGHARDVVGLLAQRKAEAVAASETYAIVIASDTLVSLEGRPLGKPADAEDARRMLRSLSGRSHDIYTGVCVIDTANGQKAVHVEHSTVHFRPIAEAELDAYVQSGEPMDKAGAYAIQGGAGAFVTEIHGSFSSIMGLPVEALTSILSQFNL